MMNDLDSISSRHLIDFFHQLPIEEKDLPVRRGTIEEQADAIYWWMHTQKIQNFILLNLPQKGLVALPREISFFNCLQTLELAGNRLFTLPDEIGELEHLSSLSVHHNELTSLPSTIGKLKRLKRLYLDHNRLEELPVEIGMLSALRRLYLNNNQLKILPAEIGRLEILWLLNLEDNQLEFLPVEFMDLINLENLNLSDNLLDEEYFQIHSFERLRVLNLSRNQLTFFPPSIATCQSLTQLDLSANQLMHLPPEMWTFNNLAILNLSDNQFVEISPDIESLIALDTLDLAGNSLTSIPASIARLNNLSSLDLRENEFLTEIPLEIERMPPLRYLFSDPILVRKEEQLSSWWKEFKEAFPEDDPANRDYWDSHTSDFSPLTSLTAEEQDNLLHYLQRIRETDDYQADGLSKQNIILRVERMVQLACKNPEFRALLLGLLTEGLEECGDRVLLIFNEIEILWQFHYKELTDEQFRALAIRASRYELLKQHALKVASEHGFEDKVETTLFYHIQLRESLDLPITTEGMLYPGVAGVTSEMLDEARNLILSYSDKYLLSKSGYWQERMAQKYSLQKEEISLKYYDWLVMAEEYDLSENKEDWLASHQEINPVLRTILIENSHAIAAVLIGHELESEVSELDTAFAGASGSKKRRGEKMDRSHDTSAAHRNP